MKERIRQEKIHILTEYSQKIGWEKQLRSLWTNCFGDPQHYEDFYFDKVYVNNKVYAIEDKGMLHLNSYRCKVMGRDIVLPYIVGVATDQRYRRQGVMRELMEQALWDLYEQKVPFTYLMPAKEEYYTPFGFQSISKKSECELLTGEVKGENYFQYLTYREVKKLYPKVQTQLLEEVNRWLEQRYNVYAVHDKAYYELLYAEKVCQSGDVIFCFENIVDANHLYGVFAYAMDGATPYVEQMILKEQISHDWEWLTTLFSSFFVGYDRVKIVQSYPYMIRIIDLESFVELFGEKLSAKTNLPIEDMMNPKEMIEYLFTEKDSIYFAEIV